MQMPSGNWNTTIIGDQFKVKIRYALSIKTSEVPTCDQELPTRCMSRPNFMLKSVALSVYCSQFGVNAKGTGRGWEGDMYSEYVTVEARDSFLSFLLVSVHGP